MTPAYWGRHRYALTKYYLNNLLRYKRVVLYIPELFLDKPSFSIRILIFRRPQVHFLSPIMTVSRLLGIRYTKIFPVSLFNRKLFNRLKGTIRRISGIIIDISVKCR